MQPYTHWIFDMDGTLTVAMHDFDAIRGELGLTPGRPILEELAEMGPEAAAPLERRLNEIELELSHEARAAAGAGELLSELRARGVQPGIVTRNNRENVRVTLSAAGIAEFFEDTHIMTRDDAPPKPDPAAIQYLLKAWNADPADAAMVGDYSFDLEAGRAAGTATIYVDPAGQFPFRALADVCVRELHELRRRAE
jgi:HAD superfamily hydrolase (TIGR01509 family)